MLWIQQTLKLILPCLDTHEASSEIFPILQFPPFLWHGQMHFYLAQLLISFITPKRKPLPLSVDACSSVLQALLVSKIPHMFFSFTRDAHLVQEKHSYILCTDKFPENSYSLAQATLVSFLPPCSHQQGTLPSLKLLSLGL